MRDLKGKALTGSIAISILLLSINPIMGSDKKVEITSEMDKQDETKKLEKIYVDMYAYMIGKDINSLDKILDDDFVLGHMTGMRQPKKEYLQAIKDSVLKYYSCDESEITVIINGNKAEMTGKSKVNAAVFGGGKHTWRLQLCMDLIKKDGCWKITEIRASTY